MEVMDIEKILEEIIDRIVERDIEMRETVAMKGLVIEIESKIEILQGKYGGTGARSLRPSCTQLRWR